MLAGLGLTALNARSTEANFDEQLGVYLKALVANVASTHDEFEGGALPVIDPQFELAFSGWYWQITRVDLPHPEIRTSRSLFATQLPNLPLGDASGTRGPVRSGYVAGPGDKPLRMIERDIDDDDGRYLIQVAANADVIQTQIERFEYALAATFLVLAVALLGSTALAVRFGLRPLRVLQEGLAAIRRGEAERIEGDFPQDVAPLAGEVNLLIDANRAVVERARTHVGNLAHALKTPLSVMVNEADSNSPRLADKVREQAEVMRHQVSFYLDRARAAARAGAAGAGTETKPVVEQLVRTFEKVYGERALAFVVEVPDGLKFRGESQDLTDLIGNLLDNAGKWARARIVIHAEPEPTPVASGRSYFVATIDDDGPGLGEAAAPRGAGARPASRRIAPRLGSRPVDRRRCRQRLRRRLQARGEPARRPARDPAPAAAVKPGDACLFPAEADLFYEPPAFGVFPSRRRIARKAEAMLWVVLAGMTGLAALAALWPLVFGRRRALPPPGEAAFFKAQLGEIDRDVARGQLPAEEAAGARAEAARRLIAASAAATAERVGPEAPWARRVAAAAIALAVPIVALGLYFEIGRPDLPDAPLAGRTADVKSVAGVAAALARVERRLAAAPNDLQGWSIAAPVYMRLGRFVDAVNAYAQILRLNGETAQLRADYGEALVGASGGIVTADARAAFDRALVEQPGLPSARFYLGLAAEQEGDAPRAIAVYRALLADAPPQAPWAPVVQARLAGLEGGTAAPAPAPAATPPGDQDAMIQGMVERLATRLAANGGDADEWSRLIRAYSVLHEGDKAKAALAAAHKALVGDAAAGQALDALARELGIGG